MTGYGLTQSNYRFINVKLSKTKDQNVYGERACSCLDCDSKYTFPLFLKYSLHCITVITYNNVTKRRIVTSSNWSNHQETSCPNSLAFILELFESYLPTRPLLLQISSHN